MARDAMSLGQDRPVLVADACLMTAAVFCLLIFAPQLALLAGPALAWVLHGRSLDVATALGGLAGIVAGFAVAAALFGAAWLVSLALGQTEEPLGSVAIVLLGLLGASFLATVVWLDTDAVRDLSAARRAHVRLDAARLIGTAVILLFAGIVTYLQSTTPAGEFGDAGVFALGAAVVGAVTMLVMTYVRERADRRAAPSEA